MTRSVNFAANRISGRITHRKMKLKLLTMSLRTYSGRLMKASGCFTGNGNLFLLDFVSYD